MRIDGLLLEELALDELDLSLRGGVVKALLGLRRRVGVSGPGVEMARLVLDLEGVEVEQVMMEDGRGRDVLRPLMLFIIMADVQFANPHSGYLPDDAASTVKSSERIPCL